MVAVVDCYNILLVLLLLLFFSWHWPLDHDSLNDYIRFACKIKKDAHTHTQVKKVKQKVLLLMST